MYIAIIHMYVYVRPMIYPMISPLVLALKPEALQGHGRRKRWGAGLVGGARAGDGAIKQLASYANLDGLMEVLMGKP